MNSPAAEWDRPQAMRLAVPNDPCSLIKLRTDDDLCAVVDVLVEPLCVGQGQAYAAM